jgi:DNA-binding transcriptional ArsR family regulator
MLVIRFGRRDLANVRFAISPLVEVHRSVRALDDPAARALHLPWITASRELVADVDVDLLRALQPRNAYTPDFVHPPPSSPLAQLDDELAEMLATPGGQIRAEIGHAYRNAAVPAVLRPFIDEPDVAVARLADVIRDYWQLALAPHWQRLRNVLEGDVLYRARQIADGGASRLLADLHPEVRFEQDALIIEKPWQATRELDGRGLLFVPSAFAWPFLAAIIEPPWQPTLIYPARGVGTLWEPGHAAAPQALSTLLGRRRAAVLAGVDAPRSTSELAHRLGLSTPSVSQHLAVLRDAGLVHANRVGRVVLYGRTPRGDQLLAP